MSVLAIMSLIGWGVGMGFSKALFRFGHFGNECARTRTTFQTGGRVISKPLGKEPQREKGLVAMHVRRANSPMCFWLGNGLVESIAKKSDASSNRSCA